MPRHAVGWLCLSAVGVAANTWSPNNVWHRTNIWLWVPLVAGGVEFATDSVARRSRQPSTRVQLLGLLAQLVTLLSAVFLINAAEPTLRLAVAGWLMITLALSRARQLHSSHSWSETASLWVALILGSIFGHNITTESLLLLGLLGTAATLLRSAPAEGLQPEANELTQSSTFELEDATLPSWAQHDSTLHDLGNAVTSAQFIVRDLARALENSTEQNFARAARLSKELVAELSQMSDQISSSRQSARWQLAAGSATSLLGPVRTCIDHVSRLYPDVRCELRCNVPEQHTRISAVGGESTVRRVVENLIINACQAQVGSRGKRVVCTLEANEREVVLTIADRGPGFTPVILRLHPSPLVSTKASGTGIGLYGCYLLVKRDGGKLTLSNRDKGGACVTASWPRPPAATEDQLANSGITTTGTRQRVAEAAVTRRLVDKG